MAITTASTYRHRLGSLASRSPLLGWMQRNGVLFALFFLTTYFALASERFFRFDNFEVILVQAAVVGLVAVPGAMLVLSGYVDLSVGSVAVLTAITMGSVFERTGNLTVAIAVSLAVALAWGIMNGTLIAFLGLSPIIVTLGGLAGARGVALVLSEGRTAFGFGDEFAFLGNGEIFEVRLPVWIAAGTVIAGAFFWYQTPYGRHWAAIGANRTAAHSLGIGVRQLPFMLYAASGLAAGAAGLILTARLDAASLSIGNGLELQVLTAILLGGVAFTGGRGTLAGVVWGVLFISVLTNGLTHINVDVYYTNVALGIALVMAAALDRLYERLERVRISEDRAVDEGKPSAEVSRLER